MLHDNDLLSIQEVRAKVDKAHAAQKIFATFSQEQVDAVVEAMAAAGRAHAREFAELAVEETRYGNVPDKIAKNLLCAEHLPNQIRHMRTVGVLRELAEEKIIEIGVPAGVVAAVTPTTNPTSTAIYKSIISLKGGNAIVISPHPRAKRCTAHTAEVLHKAAVAAGAPEGIIQCINVSTMEGTQALMSHRKTGVILATGGSAMVRAAYSSGKPAFGVGPGNVPALVDSSTDVAAAVQQIVAGKSFDYGTVCSSEQSIVSYPELRGAILAELKKNKAHLASEQQSQALAKLLIAPGGTINPSCVGQPPQKIAKMAGFEVPAETSVIAVEIEGVGKLHPLSAEKLSPVLSLLFVKDFAAALDACEEILHFGGLGHTSVIWASDEAKVRQFGLRMPSMRVLVNTPAPQGSTGLTTSLLPSMTLGCGAIAGNVTGDNVGPLHLINIKRVAYVTRRVEDVLHMPDTSSGNRPAGLDRETIVAAVEKYLAQRGLATPARPAVSEVAANVVDRFLGERGVASKPVAPPVGGGCGCSGHTTSAASCGIPQASVDPAPPAQKIAVVDFVAEADVRLAIQQGKKIHIGPKTIVTPSAREMAAGHDILVMA
jgi:acetaldehyde dehydrogenase (acetylating)